MFSRTARGARSAALARSAKGGFIGLAAGLVVVAAASTQIVQTYERRTLDLRTQAFADPRRADPRIAVVVIDQKSLDAIAAPPERGGLDHGWPWPRDYYAAVVQYLFESGAQTVAIDIVFSEPSLYTKLGVADDDADLARAYTGRPVVQAAVLTRERVSGSAILADRAWPAVLREARRSRPIRDPAPSFNKATLPIEPLLRATDRIGWIGFEPDQDGVCRSIRPAASYAPVAAAEAVEVLAFPLVIAAAAGAALETVPGRPVAEHLVVNGHAVAIDEDGRMLLRFHGGEGTYRQFSFAKVLESAKRRAAGQAVAAARPDEFRNNIVVIAANAAGLLDLRATPVGATAAAYLIHTTALDNLLHGDALWRVPRHARAATVIVLATVCGALVAALAGFRAGTFLALGLAAGYAAVALWAFQARGLWLDLVPPTLALGIAYAGSTGYLYVTEGRQRRFLRDAFSRYLSPDVVEDLVADPSRLALGGESRPATVMFVDVAGFTSFSEGRAPSELVALMNEYFTALTEVIQQHGGTVDKFIGDAIMAFWNAPGEQPDHAVRAARAAQDLLEAVGGLNRAWTARGLKPIGIRIGIATGPTLVGNVGSRSKFNYTAMGDTVNLASRLEGAAKVYHTRTLISGPTADAARGAVPFRELDWLVVKGKSEPVPVYELVPGGLPDPARKDVYECFAEGLAAYRARRFDEAVHHFQTALCADAGDGPSVEMLSRCREFLVHPPPDDWQGAHVLTSK